MGRRTLLLIASILVAAVGTALIFLYVHGADDRAAVLATPTKVIAARNPIPAGTSVTDAIANNAFTTIELPRASLPDGWLPAGTGLSDLAKMADSTALYTIPKNRAIATSDFGGADAGSTTGIGQNDMALSIQLSDPGRTVGLLKPGSRVAVIWVGEPTNQPKDQEKHAYTEFLMTDIRIISVGSNGQPVAAGGVAETVNNNIVAVSVTPDQALQLKLGENTGELSLAILGPGTKIVGKAPIDKLVFT